MQYFTFEEFERSATARDAGIDNTLPAFVKPHIEHLVHHILDPLRTIYGDVIQVTSGYRCPALNERVGGAPHSQHLLGLAADITATPVLGNHRVVNQRLATIIRNELPFDQLILYRENAAGPDFLHVSIAMPGLEGRRMVIHRK